MPPLERDQSTMIMELMKGDYLTRLSTHCPLPELYRREDFWLLTDEEMAVVGERQMESDAYRAKRQKARQQQVKEDFLHAGRFLASIAALLGVYIGLPVAVALCIVGIRHVHGNTSILTGPVHHDAHARAVDGGTSHAGADADPRLPGDRAEASRHLRF